MYWDEHAPPHFHAEYGGAEAVINIQTLEITKGKLPHGAALLVKEWAMQHRNELMEDWKLCEQLRTPNKIAPLE
ncbi:MAG: DUF4160 domain-containing protein [Gallionella sp.]|nr:DUF4160 domain-containing protein [Gallionella sp.]